LLDGNLLVSHSQAWSGISRRKGDMAVASRAQRAVTDVTPERWEQFGRALQEWREDVLGYQVRGRFAEDRFINLRLVQDLEKNYRPGTYTKWALQDAAPAYQVPYSPQDGPGSILAFLHGDTDTLARATGKPAVKPGRHTDGPDGWRPPVADRARRDADAPYAAPILDRLLALADSGVTDPTGAQVFGAGTDDARAWDGPGAWVRSPRDRAWFIAEIRRWEAGRDSLGGNSGTGAAGA